MTDMRIYLENCLAIEALLDPENSQLPPCLVDLENRPAKSPEPRYVMVEVGPEAIPALEEHWQTGRPVELLGVVFEFAVVARTVKRLFRETRYVVRGVKCS